MKIKDAVAIAAGQFIQRFNNSAKTLQLLESYAIEELELVPDQSKKFAEKAVGGQTTEWLRTEEDNSRFFTWYFINHVTKNTIPG